jgi:hypothetical protein
MADKRDIITTPRMLELLRRKRKRQNFVAFILFVLLIGVVIGLSYLSGYEKLVITDVVVEGTHIIDQAEVKGLVQKDLSGKYVYLFRKANTFIYPSHKLHDDIIKAFPRTDKLEIKRLGLKGLSINITERSGSYLWCGSDIPKEVSKIGEDCYFLNTDGYIFDKAPYFSGDVYFKFYIPLGEGVDPLGSKVLPPEIFKPTINFIDGVTSLGLHPVSLIMNNEMEYVLNLSHTSTSNPKILFNKESDLPTIFSNLAAAFSKPEFKNEIMNKYNTLKYIDLKFKNKVLYKFNE